MNKKSTYVFSFILLSILLLVPKTVKATTPKLNKSSVTLDEGKTYTLKVKNLPEDAKVKYTSADKKVATVSSTKGKITAVTEGETKITAKITFADKMTKSLKCTVTVNSIAPKDKVYTITPESEPFDPKYKNYHNYNKYTNHYIVFMSYMNEFDRVGGGTLILSKGTYTVTNTVYIPSNVTIKLEDGVIIKKGNVTGLNDQPASHAVFTLCEPSKSTVEGAYSGYNGVHDVKLLGSGNATIDLDYDEKTLGITLCHCKDIEISGLNFKNMYSGHFIECDASKNVTIADCTFSSHKDSANKNKEAINLDTPDKATGGINAVWSSYDKTGNDGVAIKNCSFMDLERAIGTHKFSENHPHINITVENCIIDGCDNDAIRVMNWHDFIIKNNKISNVKGKSDLRGILLSGAYGFDISNNSFENVPRAMQFLVWHQDNGGYANISNDITYSERELLITNTIKNGTESFIRWNKVYNVYNTDTEKIQIRVL